MVVVLFLLLSIFCVLFFLISRVYDKHISERIKIKASDGNYYWIRNTGNKEADIKTAEMLSSLNEDIEKLLTVISDNEMVERIKKRYKPTRTSEGVVDKRYTSYTINKGEEIIMCLRSRDSDELYDKNKLMYVMLHELAHIGSLTKNHNEEFRNNFDYLLAEAQKHGLYTPINQQFDYCGLHVH